VNTPVIRQVLSTSRLLIQLNRHQISAGWLDAVQRRVSFQFPSGSRV